MLSTPRSLGFVLAAILGAMLVPGCRSEEALAPSDSPISAGPQFSATSRAIPDEYIVVFKRGLPDPAAEARALVAQHRGTLRFAYTAALKGFAARLPAQALEAIKRNPNVAYVEQDAAVELFGGGTQPAPPAPWGLNRIDQRTLPLDASYSYGATGAGVNAYIIDTGIRTTHQDFGGRAVWDFNAVKGNEPDTDCLGHGTHVAGIVGSTTYGVAKAVSLHAVKVLDCTGSGRWSWVIAGIDWVTAHAAKPAVANMSLGGDYNKAVNDAVAGSVASGVTYAVAAGNSSTDACKFSPASTPTALTVGATTNLDALASYSNVGSCVDLFAPGSFILSDFYRSDTDAVYLSGTSMATPHVAGAAALYLETHPSASPAEVSAAILTGATQNVIAGLPVGAANLLLFTGDPAAPEPIPGSGGGSCVPSKPQSKNCK